MDCQRVITDEIAGKYLNGRLDAALQDEFEVHLLECPKCLAEVEAVTALTSVLKEQAHEIRLKQPRRILSFRWIPIAAAALVCVLFAVGVVQMLRHHQPQPTTAQPTVAPVVQSPEQATQAQPESSATSKTEPVQQTATVQPRMKKPGTVAAPGKHAVEPQPTPPVASPAPVLVAQAPEQKLSAPAVRPPLRQAKAALTQEQGAELFRLGMVDPPAYTFSGFGDAGKTSAAGSTVKGYSTAGPHESARALFQNGMMAYVEGRYRDATEKLEGAAQAEPDAPDANFYLGICRLVQGHPTAAVQPFKKVIVNGKSPLVQSAHFYLAKAYVQTNDLAAAETELQASAAMAGLMKKQAESLLSKVQAFRAQLAK
jgi:TolA-binding protein